MILLEHSPSLIGLPPWKGMCWGHWGLAVFFSLSGYMVSLSAKRSRGPFDFIKRRLGRIGPAYLVVSLFVLLVIWPIFTKAAVHKWTDPISLLHFWIKLVAGGAHWELPGLFMKHAFNSANGSLWSLPYEVLLYAFICVIWFTWLQRSRLPGVLIPAILWIITTILFLGSEWLLPNCEFKVAGFRIYYIFEFCSYFAGGWTLAEASFLRNNISILFVVAILIRITLTLSGFSDQAYAFDAVLFPITVVFIGKFPIFKNHSLPDWSYGFYLWAWPVQQCLIDCFPHLTPISLTLYATAVTLLPAALSWSLVEYPVLKKIRSKL